METREAACKAALVQGVQLGPGLRRAHTSPYLLGTSLFPGPVHSKLGSHRSGWSWSLSSATSLEQGWPRASGTAGLEAGQGAAQHTRS